MNKLQLNNINIVERERRVNCHLRKHNLLESIRRGGGLQADPRLLDSTLFKAAYNATVMQHAKEMLRKIKPDFKISTSWQRSERRHIPA